MLLTAGNSNRRPRFRCYYYERTSPREEIAASEDSMYCLLDNDPNPVSLAHIHDLYVDIEVQGVTIWLMTPFQLLIILLGHYLQPNCDEA